MKKNVIIFLCCFLCGVFIACDGNVTVPAETVGPDSSSGEQGSIDFGSQYIRTDGYNEEAEYPIIKIIRSVEELNAYYSANRERYSLERRQEVYSDGTIGFLDACDKYDEAYFEKQMLVMVLLEECSGSIRHHVDNVKLENDGKLHVSIRTIVPEITSDDMAMWHILIEMKSDVQVADESGVVVYLNGVNPVTQPRVVRATGPEYFANITLTIPRDWKYEIEQEKDSGSFCISFWPEEETEGKIKMWYHNFFGVCGTGLEEEEIVIGAYKARKGIYWGEKMWNFISFVDTPGSYVAINEGAHKWGENYVEQAMQILSTIRIAEGIIKEEQAIGIAKENVTVKYNQVDAKFDAEDGLWEISFSQENVVGGDQIVVITSEGKIDHIEYGE